MTPGQMLDMLNRMQGQPTQPASFATAQPELRRVVPAPGEAVNVREVIKEVPVEVIKYVDREVIKEVPVEVIKYVDREVIKEVPVTQVVEKEVIREVPVDRVIEKEVIKEVIKYVTVDGRAVEEAPNGTLHFKHPFMHHGMMGPGMMPGMMPPWVMPPPPQPQPPMYGFCSCGKEKERVVEVVEKEVIKEVKVDVIKEVPKEVVKYVEVEVPVEVIREVVKTVEVPVEVIVEKKVEVEVTKTVEVPVQIIREVPVEVIKERECSCGGGRNQPPWGCQLVDVPVPMPAPPPAHVLAPPETREVLVEREVPIEIVEGGVWHTHHDFGNNSRDFERVLRERKESRHHDAMLERGAPRGGRRGQLPVGGAHGMLRGRPWPGSR